MTEPNLPWASFPWPRCRAVLEPDADKAGPYHGRCELRARHRRHDHALERGMDVVHFRTVVTS